MPARRLAPVVTVAVAASALAPAASADEPMATGPFSSEFTQAEVDNAWRFFGLLVGVGALLTTVGVGIVHFAGPHLGLNLPQLPLLPR